ncbi:MAG: transaminase [Thermoleophilia bacterium]|jgi:glutamate-1-semialdehyde 2,1-aminomutase|nr:transaminase [Thermoleophilia bacterium]
MPPPITMEDTVSISSTAPQAETLTAPLRPVDRERLAALLERERGRYAGEHPRSIELFERARATLLAGVPMSWMAIWSGGFPLYFAAARGNRITDVDGHTYIDFCLGDTGAMTGHSPPVVMDAVQGRLIGQGGVTTMLPTADAARVGADLQRRFGLPYWQFTLSASDANRFVLRMARQLTRRPRVLVFSRCYHGSVDETVVIADEDGRPTAKPGNVGPQVDPALTTKVVEFNDVAALRAALAPRDVACVLMEPAMTNIGIVLPEPGYLAQVRRACDETGTLLVNDETHTFSAGEGGCTRAWGLRPDVVTIGKALGSGIPIGAYGVSEQFAERILGDAEADLVDQGGVGGTLAGNALSMAAARATLEHVLTGESFAGMIDLATRYTHGVQQAIDEHRAPWCIVQLGARAEYRFCPTPPRTGNESAAVHDPGLDEFLHLYTVNRGILMTPFHNMALMCPETSAADVDRHTEVFDAALQELFD